MRIRNHIVLTRSREGGERFLPATHESNRQRQVTRSLKDELARVAGRSEERKEHQCPIIGQPGNRVNG
jgi:hypothetical protein